MSKRRPSRQAASLRKIIRIRYDFTCQECNKQLCPVGNKCYKTQPDDPLIKNFCNEKKNCIFQVHHEKKSFQDIKNEGLTVLEESKLCTLLCQDCHKKHHEMSTTYS